MLVPLTVGDPVVVLDVLGEVAELLWRRVGEAWHCAQALREAVVIVMAAIVIDLVILCGGLVAGERRGRARIDALLAAAEADDRLCGASDACADPGEDVLLESIGAGLAHGEDAHLAVEHDDDGLHMRHLWCASRHKLGRIRVKRLELARRHFLERRERLEGLEETGAHPDVGCLLLQFFYRPKKYFSFVCFFLCLESL